MYAKQPTQPANRHVTAASMRVKAMLTATIAEIDCLQIVLLCRVYAERHPRLVSTSEYRA